MKKLLSLILVVAMVMSFAITVSAAETEKTYELDTSRDLTEMAAKTKADGETEVVGDEDYFTIHYSAKTKIDGSNKTWTDPVYSGTQRLNFGGSFQTSGDGYKQGVEFTTTSDNAKVDLWFVAGGADRHMAIFDGDLNQIAVSDIEGMATNAPYFYSFTVPTAGTYYLGSIDSSNYIFKIAVTETIVTEPQPGESADNPLFLSYRGQPVETAAIPANGSLYYSVTGVLGFTVTFTGENISAVYSGKTFSAVDGIVSIPVAPGRPGSPADIQLINSGSEDYISTMDLVLPLGSEQHPAELAIGSNVGTPSLGAYGDFEYYFEEYIVEKAGTMTFTVTGSSDYDLIVAHNETQLWGIDFPDNIITFEVAEGDSIIVNLTFFDLTDEDEFALEVALEGEEEPIDPSVNGLVKDEDGNYNYYVNGVIDTEFEGLVDNPFGRWYVADGKIQFGFNSTNDGLVEFEGKVYEIRGGKVNTNLTGLAKRGGTWYYVEEGVVDATYTGLAKSGSFTYYVENGELNFNLTDVIEVEGVKYFVKYGNVANYTGLVKGSDGVWRYVTDGVFDETYTGTAKGNDGVTFFYVQNGLINFKFSGTIVENGTEFTVKNGVVIL